MTPARQAGGRVFRHARVLRAVQIIHPSSLTRSLSIGLRQLMGRRSPCNTDFLLYSGPWRAATQ